MPDAPAPTCALAPCPRCGKDVITGQWQSLPGLPGQEAQALLIAVEPHTQVYTLVWDRGAPRPRLAQSRGYVAHACGG